MKLSLCITTYNRYEMTIESFAQVLNDDRIDDIVIMDDASKDEIWQALFLDIENLKSEKIRFFHSDNNVGMSRNKYNAISRAKNEWCIIFDSDNIIGPDYLDAFEGFITDNRGVPNLAAVENNYIFCPDFAMPNFDYTALAQGSPTHGIYNKRDAARCIIDSRFNCLMNTCNYIVNRDYYISAYQYNPEHKASDTVWHNYNHLKSGGLISVVPNMRYFHRVHDGSGFMQDAKYNMDQAEKVRKLIQQL